MTAWETLREGPKRWSEAATQTRPRLRAITSPPRRVSSLGFASVVVGLLVASMIGMLTLTTVLQNQEFELRAAQRAASELGYRASDLSAQVNRAKAPAVLGERASHLGMVPNPYPAFIHLADGSITGVPRPVSGKEMPYLTGLAPEPPPAPPAIPVLPPPPVEEAPVEDPAAEPTLAPADLSAAED
ncbi:MAG: hypothetical protein Q4G34_12030, partial [Micrococcus sp.]|nr:hypothetical protein [Micrococcus sp.]